MTWLLILVLVVVIGGAGLLYSKLGSAYAPDQLAAVTHINKYYLAHAFQKEYNISPINYLLRRRITESKALLASTDHSLTQISELVGFSSPSYFSQSFRRLEGMSPIEYRRTVQKNQEDRSL